LLSRFDLVFLILDEPNKLNDENLAKHVGYVHKNLKHPENERYCFNNEFMRSYISLAKQFNPTINKEAADYI